ncbi:hypothetical protein Glove_346g107 [Diversispora epigaea]|uniref:Uncharacterized protein n=1 Tax=Diversispora epigaea TaxID=1348612 RepID=A0A397HF45_9GLOM|nr:hypothetical protein Glove_346g107 [Diversispora epigaea]
MKKYSVFLYFLFYLIEFTIRKLNKTSDLTPVKNGRDTLISFKSFEDDLKWVTHSETHGTLSQQVTTGVFIIEKENADTFSENYFSFIENKESREILIETFKMLFYTEGHIFTHKYIDITYEKASTDKPITGGFYFMYAKGSSEKRNVFISLTRLSKKSAPGHYLLKDYYKGNEDRVENALKYMIYKDANSKGLLTEN